LTKLTEYIRWNKIKHTWETKIISKTNSFLRARKTNSYIEVFQSCHLYLQSFGISMLLQSFKKKNPKRASTEIRQTSRILKTWLSHPTYWWNLWFSMRYGCVHELCKGGCRITSLSP
jgi:hypothetical protein